MISSVNEASMILLDPCQRNNGGCDHTCTRTQNGARCSCRNGYQLVNGKTCTGMLGITIVLLLIVINIITNNLTDINECIVYGGICGNDKLCFNTDGSYSCRCLIGYTLSSDGRCRGMKYIRSYT